MHGSRCHIVIAIAIVCSGIGTSACRRTPRADQMFPVGGVWYEYLHPGGLAIEAGWRQTDLYRKEANNERTLVGRDIASERYYPDDDCLVYTTGHGESRRVTSAACGQSMSLTFDTRDYDYWRMDADGLRARHLPEVRDGFPVVETVSIDDIKAAVLRGAPLTAKLRPINPNFEDEKSGRTLVMNVVDPSSSGGDIQYRLMLLEALIAHGANVSAGDRSGLTPLMLAALRDDPAFIPPLVNAGASVNATDSLGRTALMDAAGSSRNQVIKVKLLLEAGADPSLRDDEGHTAAERERNSSDAELLALLNAP